MCLAIPGRIISVDGAGLCRTGRIEFGTIVKEASLAFIPDAAIGEYVLVHAGVALGTVMEEEAQRIFGYLEELDEIHG
ncbi:MAG: HypC/HybG/HupF family hydrogenase formation chaperone [Pseudomonadota bacterium]